jgi:branched-chain amino acid transport system substrate-binding protein
VTGTLDGEGARATSSSLTGLGVHVHHRGGIAMRGWSTIALVALLLVGVVAVAPGGPALGVATSWAQAGGEIVIGTLWPLSGTAAPWGNDNLRGARIAVQVVNERGGINGKKVRLIDADNASNPSTAANEANRLITKEGVKVIMGTVVSSCALPASEVAEKNKIVYWEADAVTNNLTTRGFKYLFRVNETAAMHSDMGAKFIAEVIAPRLGKDVKQLKIVITHEDSAFGTSVSDAMEKALARYGAKAVAREAYSAKATDLSSLILKLKSAGAEIVYNTGYTPDEILFWKQAKQLNLNLKALVGGGGWSLQSTADGVGPAINGVLDASGPININPKGLQPDVHKLYDDLLARYQKAYSAPLSLSSFQGFTATWVLLNDVLRKTGGDTDPEKVRAAATSLDVPEFGTVIGWGVKFDEQGQNSRSFATVMQWQEQKVFTVFPRNLALRDPVMIPLPEWSAR